MTTQLREAKTDYSNPAGWDGYGASGFSWCTTHLADFPDSSASKVTGNTTDNFYTDHFSGSGSDFSIPTDATVNSVSIKLYAKKNSSAACALRGRLGLDVFYNGSSENLSETAALYEWVWTTNPKTSGAWTPAQINSHVGADSITIWGFNATDATASFDIFSLAIEVDYTEAGGGGGSAAGAAAHYYRQLIG